MRWNLTKSYPYRLSLAITYSCNSKCLTCGIWKLYIEKPSQRSYEMDLEEYKRLFDSLPDIIWLHLTGGEPFLRQDFVAIARYASRRFKSLTIIDTSTNGLLPTHIEKAVYEVLETEKFPFFVVGTSIDGPKSLHDHIRGVKGGWQKSFETYRRLREIAETYKNFYVHINYTISSYNAGKINELFEEFRNNGCTISASDLSVSLAHLGSAFLNQDRDFNNIRLMGDAVSRAKDDIGYLLKNSDMHTGELTREFARPLVKRIFLHLAMKYLDDTTRMVIPCAASFASCFIDPYGQVYPCTIMAKKMGSLRETSFEKIWFSEKAFLLREKIRRRMCPNCWSGCESSQSILQDLPWLMNYAFT